MPDVLLSVLLSELSSSSLSGSSVCELFFKDVAGDSASDDELLSELSAVTVDEPLSVEPAQPDKAAIVHMARMPARIFLYISEYLSELLRFELKQLISCLNYNIIYLIFQYTNSAENVYKKGYRNAIAS